VQRGTDPGGGHIELARIGDDGGLTDPVQLLPEAFARLEQIAEDSTAAAIREFNTLHHEKQHRSAWRAAERSN
jgi:hypothetical protein